MSITRQHFELSDRDMEKLRAAFEKAYHPPLEDDEDRLNETTWVEVVFRFMDGKRVLQVISSDGYDSGDILPDLWSL